MTVGDSVMWLASSGRSSANRPQLAPWPRWDRTWRWWSGPQICSPARLGRAVLIGPTGRGEAPLGAADEAAPLVGLVELERLDEVAELALPARQGVLEQAGDVGERMHHQPLADEAGRVGQAVRMLRRRRQQQQPRRADRVGREDDDLGRLASARRRRGRSRSRRSRGPRSSVSMLADPGAGDEPRPMGDAPSASGSGRSRPWRPRCSPDWQVLRWTHGRRPS